VKGSVFGMVGVPDFAVKPAKHECSAKDFGRLFICLSVKTRGELSLAIDFSWSRAYDTEGVLVSSPSL